METTTFQEKECYITYKEFKTGMIGARDRCSYQLNNWYELKDDLNDSFKDLLFKSGLLKNPFSGFLIGDKVFKCFIPKDSVISDSITNEKVIRCYKFYLSSEEIDITQFDWDILTDHEKKAIIFNNPPNFNCENYWDTLTEDQKDYCICHQEFDYDKHWHELTNDQIRTICKYNKYFNYKKYWNSLDIFQKDSVCIRPDFDYEKYWDELDDERKLLVSRHNPNFDYEKYWNEKLEEKQNKRCFEKSFGV